MENIFRHRDLTVIFAWHHRAGARTISRNVRPKVGACFQGSSFQLSRAPIRCRYRCYTGNSCRNPREPQSRVDDTANVERGPRAAAQGRTGSIHHGYPQRDVEIPSQLVSSNRRVPCSNEPASSLYLYLPYLYRGSIFTNTICLHFERSTSVVDGTKVSPR